MRKGLIVLLLMSWVLSSQAQDAITVKYFGLTWHPFGDPSAHLQPLKLDDKARLVANYGVFLGYEKYLYEDLISVKTIQGVMADCSNGLAVVSHIGVRGAIYKSEKHRFYAGIGPTLIVRDSWGRFGEEYTGSGFFNETTFKRLGEVQWKMIAYGIDLEYDYAFSATDQLSISVTPGVPMAATIAVGWKHWFNLKEFDPYRLYVPRKKD